MKSSPILLALLLTFVVTLRAVAADPKPAPDISLITADGRTVQLSDFAGRVVLLDFWASWCAPCKTSFPALDKLFRENEARGFTVFAVNLDKKRSNADEFLTANPHAMTIVFDPDGKVSKAFRIFGLPSSVLIDRSGNIRFTHLGYNAKVVERYVREINTLLAEPAK